MFLQNLLLFSQILGYADNKCEPKNLSEVSFVMQ
jgi:hypothetical protein